ncbi:MAG: hypothetical protein ACTSWK_05920 [Promethearchaeota archaeon]
MSSSSRPQYVVDNYFGRKINTTFAKLPFSEPVRSQYFDMYPGKPSD